MNINKEIKYFISIGILLTSCVMIDKNNVKYENIDNIVLELEFIQENYERNDLLFIMGYGPNINELTSTVKISPEELNRQEYLTLYELIDNINIIKLINNSDYFINNYFRKMYTEEELYFNSIEFITLQNEIFGNNKNIKRNDWIIALSYSKYGGISREKIFVLPDYRIIISSNNYEGIIKE
jgi:hypothetical protein